MEKVFQGIDHKLERLYIHWDITTKCNYNCNYCYAKKDYSKTDSWQKETQDKIIRTTIASITKSTLPVFLGLLGGEPTTSKYYFEILESLKTKLLPKHKDNRLYITTNLSKDMKYWEDHPKLEKTFILASFHPEYHNEKSTKEFIDKLKYLRQYFKVKVNIMLDPKFDEVTSLWVNYLENKELKDIIIHPHIIYPDGSPHTDIKRIYKDSITKYEKLYSYMQNEYFYQNKELTDLDVFKNNLNTFKGWDCYQNNYEISYDGYVSSTCFPNRINLVKDILYFRKIHKIVPRKCPHDFCSCDGLLKCKKVRNAS